MSNFLSGIFNGPQQNGFSTGQLQQTIAGQQGNISNFSNQLSAMRSQYLAQIPGLNQSALSQFGANAQGQMGANGLTANSGAFADALARQAIPMQASMINTGYQTGVSNANAVMGANTSLTNATLGAQSAGLSGPTPNPFAAGLGNLIGTAGMYYAFGPAGAAAAPAATNAMGLGSAGYGNAMGSGTGAQPVAPSYAANPGQDWDANF